MPLRPLRRKRHGSHHTCFPRSPPTDPEAPREVHISSLPPTHISRAFKAREMCVTRKREEGRVHKLSAHPSSISCVDIGAPRSVRGLLTLRHLYAKTNIVLPLVSSFYIHFLFEDHVFQPLGATTLHLDAPHAFTSSHHSTRRICQRHSSSRPRCTGLRAAHCGNRPQSPNEAYCRHRGPILST